MSGKENIKKWRKKKAKEGYKSRSYVLHEDIIDAIEAIAEKTNLDKSEVVSKAIKKLVRSDYQKEIGIKKKGLEDFEEKIKEMSGDLQQLMRFYFQEKYEKKNTDEMKEFLSEKEKDEYIEKEEFYDELKTHKLKLKFTSYQQYKRFLRAFNLLNPSESTNNESTEKSGNDKNISKSSSRITPKKIA